MSAIRSSHLATEIVTVQSHRNQNLYDAIRTYVPIAIDHVVRKATAHVPISELNEESFFFSRMESSDELARLEEYQQCVEKLSSDLHVSNQIGALVGDNSYRERTPNVSSLMSQLVYMGLARGEYVFNPEYFERQYNLFEHSYYNEFITYDVIAPLQNFLLRGSVELSEDLEISPLTDDDVDPNRSSTERVLSEEVGFGKASAVRSKFQVRKLIGDDAPINIEESEKDRERFVQTAARVDEVVDALRLFEVETVYYSAVIFRTSRWLFRDEKVFPTRMRDPIPLTYDRGDDWLDSFKQFWQSLQSDGVKRREYIGVAIRRLGYALERGLMEDRVVDFLIAAEAIFLSDAGSAKYRGELQYRLALRAAFLMGTDDASRIVIYDYFRQAYKIRSSVSRLRQDNPAQEQPGRAYYAQRVSRQHPSLYALRIAQGN
jgi:hypothetical protein